MHVFTQPGAPSLLRLIVELKGSDMPSNDVYLEIVSDRESGQLDAELDELEAMGLIAWSEVGQQWTPTMRGLILGLAQPAFEPGVGLEQACAECA